jgi:site-specific recombinase XerD
VASIFSRLNGLSWIMANLLYGAGPRLMECPRLRVKDIDFLSKQIVVRSGKGDKDRVTMLPEKVKEPLRCPLEKVKKIHDEDVKAGFGEVYLPYAPG